MYICHFNNNDDSLERLDHARNLKKELAEEKNQFDTPQSDLEPEQELEF